MAYSLLPLSNWMEMPTTNSTQHQQQLNNQKNSETMSEVSECGTVTSGWTSKWDCKEELTELVSRLGLSDVTDLYQERFRVDRWSLEKMLTGENDALFPADVFFAKLMEDTDTLITWPNKLKIGAKSKKDPHVRIAGRRDDVQTAKERILSVLSTKCNRITMKIDVSYTDHSHIIGKGGISIKRVMEETGCHVHFPDSNRSNPTEKSNQVSISGNIKGVEHARARLRNLIPLIFGFELPIMSKNVDTNSSYISQIELQYKVQVIFRTRPKLHATLVLVKGNEWEMLQVKEAAVLLMEYLCEDLASQTPVQMSMEISPHHHHIVLAKNHSNLKAIMQYTNCQIMFPDTQDPNIPNLKKSKVHISGSIHNVYKARQLLLGSLPLIIFFDLPDQSIRLKIKTEEIAEIQTICDVIINIRQKANKTTRACVIKGIERLASNIYKARNMVLGLNEAPIPANIPSSYFMPNDELTSKNGTTTTGTTVGSTVSASTMNGNSADNAQNMNSNCSTPSFGNPLVTPSWYLPSNQRATQSPFYTGLNQQQFFSNFAMMHSSNNYQQQSPITPNQLEPTNMDYQNKIITGSGGGSGSDIYSIGDGNFSSPSGNSTASNNNNNNNAGGGFMSYAESLSHNQQRSANDYATNLSQMNNNPGEFHGPTLSKKPRISSNASPHSTLSSNNLTPHDYENKRLSAMRAMHATPSPGSVRVPNNIWSGYGVSYTSPSSFQLHKFNQRENDIWEPIQRDHNNNIINSPSVDSPTNNVASPIPSAMMNTSNLLDLTPSHVWSQVNLNSTSWQDLPSLLISMKLERYISLFKQHEVDLTMFSTLTDQDLIDIGIAAFGARRRMLLAISELNKQNTPFPAAPGAERKSASCTTQQQLKKNYY